MPLQKRPAELTSDVETNASSPAPCDKRRRVLGFDEQYDTANNSHAKVLGTSAIEVHIAQAGQLMPSKRRTSKHDMAF